MIPIGDRYIGNTRQQNDNLIAVLDAQRLGDCCFALTEQFETEALTEIEAGKGSLFGITDPVRLSQIRGAGRAVDILQRAIEAGDLRIWRIHDGREVQIVPLRLLNNDVRYGIFNTFDRPEPEMQGAWLWVKQADWERFSRSIMAQSVENMSPTGPEPVKQKPGQKAHPGWPIAADKVAAHFVAKGYTRPLKRGQQANIVRKLLDEMATHGPIFSEDAARNWAIKLVIPKLPDNPAR